MARLSLFAMFLILVAPGCKKKPTPTEPVTTAPPPPPPEPVPEPVQEMANNFARVYFDFDSASLNSASKSALSDNVTIMSEHGDIKLEVQGHADERGTTDYNLALGQRRADAVRNYLSANGVADSRLKIVSYGEERPLATGSSESAWSQNRRAEFVITWKGDAKVKGTTE